MILKTVLPILVLWIFGYYDGVKCDGLTAHIEEKMEKVFENYRQKDLYKYLNYGIEDFEAHNRHCYLAFLVYLSKKLFYDDYDLQLKINVNTLEDFTESINRVLSTEFTKKFDNKTFILQDKIYEWFGNNYNLPEYIASVVNQSNDIIEFGLSHYIWKDEKELEIIIIYRNNTNSEAELGMIQKAYEVCKSNYYFLAKPTHDIGIACAKAYRHQSKLWYGYNFVPTEFRDFGPLTLFITDDEYRSLRHDNDNSSRNLYIMQFLEQVLIEIIRHINAVLQQMKDIVNLPDMINTDSDTSDVELLFILRHLYYEVTNTTQDLYLLFRMINQNTYILKEYILFSVSFKKKWTTIFSQSDSSIKTSKSLKKSDSSIKTSKSLKKTNETSEVKNKEVHPAVHMEQRRKFEDNEVYDPSKDLESVDLKNVDQGRFSKRKPSFIRLYSVFNNSWYEPVPNESNLNEKKAILYELNAMLAVIRHHIYSLTVAARSKQKICPAWDCGFINGISAPHTGLLKGKVDTHLPIKVHKLNASLMNELKSARKFIMEYRCPILQKTSLP